MEKIRFKAVLTMLNWKRVNNIRWISKDKNITASIYLHEFNIVPGVKEVFVRINNANLKVTSFDNAIKLIANDFKDDIQ